MTHRPDTMPFTMPFTMPIARLWLLALACLCLLACSAAPEPLRVGAIAWPGYEPLFLAEATGQLPPEMVQVVEQPAASDVMLLLRNGNLEAAYLTLDETLTLLAEGLDLQVILVADRSLGADAVLVRPPRKTLADLEGSRIGVENTAVGALMLAKALKHAGLERTDIQLHFYPINQHARAYLDGEVDALVTFEPVRSKLIAAGAVQVFDSSAVPSRIMDVLVVRRDMTPGREAQLRALAASHFAGLALLHDEPERAAGIIAQRWHVPPEEVASRFRGLDLIDLATNLDLLRGTPPPLVQHAREIGTVLEDEQLIQTAPPVETLANARYLPAD